ncbi:MAG TPA: NAD(P)/FAD-dependent oxidoreductase [Candidatus Limnocylindrales bacterium]
MESAGRLDLAVVGGGVAGAFVAHTMQTHRPDWSIALFERTDRIGGRLRSVAVNDVEHRIELGGMRFRTGHRLVADVVESLGLETYSFDRTGGSERSLLRGRLADGPDDPAGSVAYDLAAHERGRSASDLATDAFEQIIPGASRLDADGYRRVRREHRFRDRRIVDWSMGDAIASILSAEAARYVADAFGYDSGIRALNAGDGIEFMLGGGAPAGEARVPVDGMDRIPGELVARFAARGGIVRRQHRLDSLVPVDDGVRLTFSGATIDAARAVLAVPVPALRAIVAASPVMQTPTYRRILGSVEPFPAIKLYLWYERPWWRPTVRGIRSTTDMTIRKVFYLDTAPDSSAALLAMYTDGRHVEPWRETWDGATAGSPASAAMLTAVRDQLRALHPAIPDIPEPAGSAVMFWGGDPLETAWQFWRPGEISDDVIDLALQPQPDVPVYLAGESFSRSQSWVEGALETAGLVVERLLGRVGRVSGAP